MARAERGADPGARLTAGLAALGLPLSELARARLLRYLTELQKWNSAYNLTAVRDPLEMVTRHLLDSLAIVPKVRALAAQGARVLDVGSGPGLPAVPLAIALPDLRVAALDSNGKKTRFLRHAQRELALGAGGEMGAGFEVVEERVEHWQPGQPFDLVVSRAFAALPDFVACSAHLLAPQGHWLAMKGRPDPDEQRGLPATVRLVDSQPLAVPGLDEQRHLLILARNP